MFTGIVAAVGRIESISPLGASPDAGVRLTVQAGGLDLADIALGDSIAIQGACMTVIEKTGTGFDVDVSRESLNRTIGLAQPGEVNLEKALRAHDVADRGEKQRSASSRPIGDWVTLGPFAPAAPGISPSVRSKRTTLRQLAIRRPLHHRRPTLSMLAPATRGPCKAGCMACAPVLATVR